MDDRAGFVAKGIAVGRVLYGLGCMVAPRTMMGPAGERAEGQMISLTRAFGVRDLVLGGGTFAALGSGSSDAIRWVELSAAADTLDVVNAVVFGKELDRLGKAATFGLAVPASVGGWWAARGLRAG
jgi:hypothetical protein